MTNDEKQMIVHLTERDGFGPLLLLLSGLIDNSVELSIESEDDVRWHMAESIGKSLRKLRLDALDLHQMNLRAKNKQIAYTGDVL